MDNQPTIDKKIIERGLWLATHRLFIKRWVTIGLYAVVAVSFAIFFIQFGVYAYRLDQWNTAMAAAVRPFVNWSAVYENAQPQDLTVSEAAVLPRASGVYDLAAEVRNPNEIWAGAVVEYQFESNDTPLGDPLTAFILPGERRFLTLFGYQSAAPGSSARVRITRVQWERVDERIPPAAWIWDMKPQYSGRRVIIEGSEQVALPARVTWRVTNGSTYNYRTVLWQIGLYTGSRLAGIIEYTSGQFPFLGKQSFDVVVAQSLPRVDNVVVIPLVNIFDPNFSYLEDNP